MRSNEFVVERAERARDAIENIVSMDNADDYFVRFTDVDKLGYSAKQDFGRTPDIGSANYDPDALPRKTGRPALWFYPAKYYLQNQNLFASNKPYVWLVKKRPNAYLQPTAKATEPNAPAGMTRAGLMHKESGVPVAIFFRPEFDVVDRWHEPQRVRENFADGKKPGRRGLAKRVGVNCKQSVSKLRKIAANSSGERQRMAHWCANMKSGKRKTNEVDDNYYRPMTLPLGQYRGPYDPRTMMPYPGNFKDSLSLAEIVDELIYNGVKPQVITVDPKKLTATQDWLSDGGSNEPSFPEYADKPVALSWDNHLYLLDGHHRSAAALKNNRPIAVYLFDVLDDNDS